MVTVAVETFFRTLPPGRLTADEERLRQCLHDACKLVSHVLPRHVPLQQWIERRMPGEVNLAIDGSGWANLWREILPPVTSAPRSHPPDVARPPVQQASRRNTEAFFRSLPADSLSPEEEDLREAVLAEVTRDGNKMPANMVADAVNVKHHSKFLPPGVLLEEWAEQRIGTDILVFEGKHGEPVLKMRDKQHDEQRNAFFDSFPQDSFTPEEMHLREAILDFLSSKRGEVVTLSGMGTDQAIGAAKRALLEDDLTAQSAWNRKGISLKEWLERRAASEFRLEKDEKRQWNIFYIGEQEHDRDYPRESVSDYPNTNLNRGEKKETDILNWLSSLPDGSYTNTEIALRETIIEFLDRWHSANYNPPSLSQACGDEAIKAARIACLPKHISLRDWIDHRVGGEIEIVPSSNSSECYFGLRGKVDFAAIQRMDDNRKERKKNGVRNGDDGKGKGSADGKGKGKGKGKHKDDGPLPKRRRV